MKMTEQEYYDLPYGVGDRLELQSFLIQDHYHGANLVEKQQRQKAVYEDVNFKSDVDRLFYSY